MLSDNEILQLEELLKEEETYQLQQGLSTYSDNTNPNYRFLRESFLHQKYTYNEQKHREELTAGKRGCVLEGSSRSGKTWSVVDFIIYLCTEVETNCTINIYRQTYNEFKTTLYDDFKRRLDDFGLPNKFHGAEDVKSFKIGNNKVFFLGCDKIGKAHGAGCDYAFFNEAMHIPKDIFNQVEQRCRKFWIIDYNPSLTEHWIFDNVVPRPDVGFLRTTFRDNQYASTQEIAKILSYEPWETESYEVTEEGDLLYRGEPITDKNQPPPHPENVENGTADEFMWKVYGLGLRGAMKGVIFPKVEYIEKFPEIAYTYGNDFGFTSDPNVLVRYAEDEHNIWIEPLCYEPIETPEELAAFFDEIGIEKYLPITCDSSDKYTGENKGTVEMVSGLKARGYTEAYKVKKSRSVMYWLLSMKRKKIHIVKNHLHKYARKEQENYRFKEINGIQINQPVDEFNHIWDAARYAHIAHNKPGYKVFY